MLFVASDFTILFELIGTFVWSDFEIFLIRGCFIVCGSLVICCTFKFFDIILITFVG